MKPFLICLLFCFIIGLGFTQKIDETDEANLWNHAIKMEKIIASVKYNGDTLNVWQDNSPGYDRYFVTPLCVVKLETMTCGTNNYLNKPRSVLSFTVQLWNKAATNAVMLALKQNNFTSQPYNIMPLPMQMVRLGVSDLVSSKIQADKDWKSNQNQPDSVDFELTVSNDKLCNEMINDSKKDAKAFFLKSKIDFQFTMIAEQQASRKVNITGETLAKSNFFTELSNRYSNVENASRVGSVYLNSKDMNRLAREIYSRASFEEEVSSDYVSSEEENKIINELLEGIHEGKVQSNKIFEIDMKSVFWDPIFTRPDVQTEYMNNVLNYKQDDKKFHFDKAKDEEFNGNFVEDHADQSSAEGGGSVGLSIFGIGGNIGGSGGSSDGSTSHLQNQTGTIFKESYSEDELNKITSNDEVYTKWNGKKFEPKSLTLYRVNLQSLKNKNDILSSRIVTTKLRSVQNILLRPDIEHFDDSSDPISPVYFDELQAEIKTLKSDLQEIKPQINTIFAELRNISVQVGINTAERKVIENQIAQLMARITKFFR